jgi:hypothetical protein
MVVGTGLEPVCGVSLCKSDAVAAVPPDHFSKNLQIEFGFFSNQTVIAQLVLYYSRHNTNEPIN